MCRKTMDESKYRVSITIENTDRNASNTWELPDFSVASLFGGLGLDEFNFRESEIRMDVDSRRDIEILMRDLGIRIADLDSFIFDTE
jgi:hypothetical protein